MPHSVIQHVHLLALKDKMPLLRQQSLIFERRPGISLDPVVLEDEAVDLLAFGDEGDEGDDDDYDPRNPLPDFPLLHDNVVSLNELHDLHLDGGSIVSSHSSEDDFSAHSSRNESISNNVSDSDAGDEESTVTSVIVAPVHEPSPDPPTAPAPTKRTVRDEVPSHEPSSAPPIVHAPLDASERSNDQAVHTEKGGAQHEKK